MSFELRFQALTLPTSGWAEYRTPRRHLEHPTLPEQLPAFEHIANTVLPVLRSEHANAG